MATGKKRRRWLQFSLRTLLSLFLLAAGFGSGCSAHRWKQQQEVNELRETLKKFDGLSMEYIEGLDVYMLRNLPVKEKKLTRKKKKGTDDYGTSGLMRITLDSPLPAQSKAVSATTVDSLAEVSAVVSGTSCSVPFRQ